MKVTNNQNNFNGTTNFNGPVQFVGGDMKAPILNRIK